MWRELHLDPVFAQPEDEFLIEPLSWLAKYFTPDGEENRITTARELDRRGFQLRYLSDLAIISPVEA